MGVLKHRDGTQETVAVKKLKNTARNTPEMQDLQRECTIMKVIFITLIIYCLFLLFNCSLSWFTSTELKPPEHYVSESYNDGIFDDAGDGVYSDGIPPRLRPLRSKQPAHHRPANASLRIRHCCGLIFHCI